MPISCPGKASPAKLFSVAAVVSVITVGVVAAMDAIGGDSMSEISDDYDNAYMPASWVFTVVWTVIYTGLGLYGIAELTDTSKLVLSEHAIYMHVVSACLNITWLFVWSRRHIAVATAIMVALYATLQVLAYTQKTKKEPFLQLPWVAGKLQLPIKASAVFSLYATWIGFAMLLNIYTLVSKESPDDRYALVSGGIALLVLIVVVSMFSVWYDCWHNIVLVCLLAAAITVRGYDRDFYEARPFYVAYSIVAGTALVSAVIKLLMGLRSRAGGEAPYSQASETE